MKTFLGIMSLQVGLFTVSANLIMLGMIMFVVNMFNMFRGNTKQSLIFLCFFCLMIATWVIAYKGSYENSLNLMTIAENVWNIFLFIWITITIWLLFFAKKDEMNINVVCLDNRCLPTCYLLKYDNIDNTHKNEEDENELNEKQQNNEIMLLNINTDIYPSRYTNLESYETYKIMSSEMSSLINVVVNGSKWDIIVVPLIFIMIFVFAKSVLKAFILKHKLDLQHD